MKIVVGYIQSPEGKAALDAAVAEAKLRQGQLIVVHSMRGGARDEAEQSARYRAELERVESEVLGAGVTVEVRELVQGQSPSEDIVEVAEQENADLVVIGVRRRSPVGKLVLGSNAQDVLLRSSCPVLAVKPASSAP